MKGAKSTLQSSAVEGTVEASQYANMMRTSDLGLAGINSDELATDFAVGAAGGCAIVGEVCHMSITRNAHRDNLEIEQIRADIEHLRAQSALAATKLSWYDKVIYIAIGGLAISGLGNLLELFRGGS